jgi:N-acetylmuramoyl-L-alanine amidase
MMALAEHLLKVIICSALFTGYYWLALRNKLFHQWNRFYLLGAVILSITIPFAKFTVWQKTEEPTTVYHVLQTITTEEKWFEEEAAPIPTNQVFLTKESITFFIYSLVSAIMFVLMMIAITRIIKLFQQNPHWKLNGLTFVDTEAKGTPFSFLHYIFWNRKIDFESAQGQQIFSHELVHVQEKHTWDKLFINFILVFFWINPFFWLMKKELTMIHEFIADKRAVAYGDASAFAAMILAVAFPGQTLSLTNPFFYSPVKRRLLMLSKLNNPKMGYISRLLLLPLLTLLFAAFSLKIKDDRLRPITLDKEYVVVIDAGHGFNEGKRNGSASEDGYSEDEFVLTLAKSILESNKNEKIKIVLTRKDEQFVDLKNRTQLVNDVKADLLISLHANYTPPSQNGNNNTQEQNRGIEAYIPTKNTDYASQSSELANFLLQEVSHIINPNRGIKTRQQGIWTIEQSNCPSVLLECGFLSNKEDLKILKDDTKRKEMARAILKGVENYLLSSSKHTAIHKDTIPNTINFWTVFTKDSAIVMADSGVNIRNADYQKSFPILIINGKTIPYPYESIKGRAYKARFCEFYPANDDETIKRFGTIAKGGAQVFYDAVEIDRSLYFKSSSKKSDEPVFTNAEVMPQFPGGDLAWNQFVQKILQKNIDSLKAFNTNGTCNLDFIVETDGSIKEISGSGFNNTSYLIKLFTTALTNGPKWIPAIQNGKKVRCKIEKKVTYKSIDTESEKENNSAVSIANQSIKILYIGLENELIVTAGSVPDNKIVVSIDNGSIKKKDVNTWVAYPAKPGIAVVTISKNENGKTEQLMQSNFSVKIIPPPVITVADSKGGRVEAAKFKSATQINAASFLDEDALVTSYTFYITGFGFEKKPGVIPGIKGNQFPKEMLEHLEKAGPGSTIVIDEIKIKTKQGEMRGPTVAFNLY